MPHDYDRNCGCDDCCKVEEAQERHEQSIDRRVQAEAARLLANEDYAWDVITDLPERVKRSLLQDLGVFTTTVERMPAQRSPRDDAGIVEAAVQLCKGVQQHIAAVAEEQARRIVEAGYDS